MTLDPKALDAARVAALKWKLEGGEGGPLSAGIRAYLSARAEQGFVEPVARLAAIIVKIADRHIEMKEGSNLVHLPMSPRDMKELRSAVEPFRAMLSAAQPQETDNDAMQAQSDVITRLASELSVQKGLTTFYQKAAEFAEEERDALKAELAQARKRERQACIQAILGVPDRIVCIVDVPAQEDITSMGRPYMAEAYSIKTTRNANRDDFITAISARAALKAICGEE